MSESRDLIAKTPVSTRTPDELEVVLQGEAAVDQLIGLATDQLKQRVDSPFWTDEQFVAWRAQDRRDRKPSTDRWSPEHVAQVATRIQERVLASRWSVEPLDGQTLEEEEPAVSGTVSGVGEAAELAGRAVRLDLAVAAGAGRALWDTECECWVKLPHDVQRGGGRYLALTVSGDSMHPLLQERDTLLVKLGPTVAPNTIIVARHVEDGYVVKCVGAIERGRVELLSLNPSYAPVRVSRRQQAVLGTVVARWRAEERST